MGIHARQIMDSRGNPTVECDVTLSNGAFGRAAVPSGASTGSFEAIELRDGGTEYMVRGVSHAVRNVNEIIAPAIVGMDATHQTEIDEKMLALDGTENKSKLGANAILAVSLAIARAAANSEQISLYKYIARVYGNDNPCVLPRPMMNIVNGGAHADNGLDVQEFMIIPVGAKSESDAIRMGATVFHHLKSILKRGGNSTNVGDEGGLHQTLIPPTKHWIQLWLRLPMRDIRRALMLQSGWMWHRLNFTTTANMISKVHNCRRMK